MAPIRRSDRAPKPRVYWDPIISPPRPRRTQQSAFTIYTEPFNPSIQLSEHLSNQFNEGLTKDLSTQFSDEDLGSELSNNDLGSELSDDDLRSELSDDDLRSELSDDDLGSELSDDDLGSELSDAGLTEGLTEGLSTQFSDKDLSEHLSRQLHESLDAQLSEDQPYQPQFLPKDRAGKPQNLSEDPDPLKLFQLFFTVKEIENIVEQTNQRAAYIDFKHPWKPLTVTEAYRYLGCLVYMGVQPLRELSDHWYHLKSPVASCFTERRFYQIRRAFTIRDPNTSPEQPEDS
jgi:hypothetical protein